MKLLLLGHTRADAEPWPIMLPGEAKPLSSTKIADYVNEELWYYVKFYSDFKHCGPPFAGGWTEWPPWCTQIITAFDRATDEVRAWREEQTYKRMGN